MPGLLAPWSGLRRNAMACVALRPAGGACRRANVIFRSVTALEARLRACAVRERRIRMNGCPNGPRRGGDAAHLAEIGLVGKGPGS